MGRLTNNIDYCSMHCDFGKRGECFFKDKSKCYEKSMHDKLKAYEDIIDEPKKLKLIDALYLERCREINRLKAELAEIRNKAVDDFANWLYENHKTDLTEYIKWYEEEAEQALERMKEVQDVN